MKKQYTILSILVVLYLINGICSINALSVTFDEGAHFSYGIRMLKGQPDRINVENDNSKMPISALNAIPRAVEQLFNKDLKREDNGVHDITRGRYITLFFSVGIILLVFVWSRKLYGVNAGLFSAFLFICCPNNMASAVLVTTDSYSVLFLLATMYFFWKYCNSKSTTDFICFALLLALSQLAKQSLFHLYLLSPLCVLVYVLVRKEKIRMKVLFRNLLIVITASWLIINIGFLFYATNMPLGEYHFRSGLFLNVQNALPHKLPVLLPKPFLEGLDLAKYYDNLGGGLPGSSMCNVTILGHSATGTAFWYYYFVSIFFKTPIPYFILMGWALYLLCTKGSFRSFIKNEFFLLAPILYFLVLLSFFYKSQGGIRHIIFIYPLLFIFSGIIFKYFEPKRDMLMLVLLSLFLVFSVGKYLNNYYPYTNEFIAVKKHAYRYVGAGNLNFGQARYFLADYMKAHPEAQMATEVPQTGQFILSVDDYLDVWNTRKYEWIRKLAPTDHVFHSYLLFEVPPPPPEGGTGP